MTASPAAMPTQRPAPVQAPLSAPDPQLSHGYWMTTCQRPECNTWIPRHLTVCRQHEETP